MSMKKDDLKEFVTMLAVIADTYGQPRPSKEAVRLYFKVLSEYSLEDVSKAMMEHLKTSSFMPKPADIIRILEGTAEDRASEAWYHVLKAMQQYGHYESVQFDNPAIHYAIERMGGWQKLCQMTEEELPYRERDFVKHYVRGERIATWDKVPLRFMGKHEQDNVFNGWDDMIPDTVFIKTNDNVKKMLDSSNKE